VSRAALLILAAAIYGRLLADLIGAYLRLITATPGSAPLIDFDIQRITLLLTASGLLVWAPVALLALWTYRCATAGAALGIPAKLEPVWGAAGWLIPVLQYWFPYQVVRDCLPPEHPRRRTAAWWWGGDVGTVVTMPAVALITVFGLVPFLIVWVVFAIVAVATAVLGLKVARAIDDTHQAVSARAGTADAQSQTRPAQP
jgi:hypothetical protein